MSRQTFEFYKDQLKDASLQTLREMVDNATEMPDNRKMLFYAAISRGMTATARSAMARWLFDTQPTEPLTND